jgi:hypothetical protein
MPRSQENVESLKDAKKLQQENHKKPPARHFLQKSIPTPNVKETQALLIPASHPAEVQQIAMKKEPATPFASPPNSKNATKPGEISIVMPH